MEPKFLPLIEAHPPPDQPPTDVVFPPTRCLFLYQHSHDYLHDHCGPVSDQHRVLMVPLLFTHPSHLLSHCYRAPGYFSLLFLLSDDLPFL
jgi:hypothetical protein